MKPLDPGFLVGEILQDTYEVEELVGEGGMAFVYRATHRILQGPVALKILQRRFAKRDDIRERFLREARLQYRLQHPHIVRVLDFPEDRGLIGCVQEWCDGGELTPNNLRVRNSLPYVHLKEQFLPLLSALGYVHEQGYIHRDIKPANILLQHQSGKLFWKLNDFGLLKDPHAEELTQSGTIFGTFHYISPEQFEESREVDHRADLYSMGVVLYQLLLGRVPFTASMPRLAIQILDSEPPFPTDFPVPLRAVLETALAKKPQHRFADCGEFEEALRKALAALEEATEPAEKPEAEVTEPFEREEPLNKVEVSEENTASPLSVVLSSDAIEPESQGGTQRWSWLLLALVVLGTGVWFVRRTTHIPVSRVSLLFEKNAPIPAKALHTKYLKNHLKRAAELAQKGNWGSTRYLLRILCKYRPRQCYWTARWQHYTKDVLRKGCKLGDAVACHWHKVLLRKKTKTARFLKKAIPLYKKACLAGEGRACMVLGELALSSKKKRLFWTEKACLSEYARGCLKWGEELKSAGKDPLPAWKKACKHSLSSGCLRWGLALRKQSLPGALKQGRLALVKACALGDQRGCNALKPDELTPKNLPKAR